MALDSVEGFFGIELSKKCKTAEWKGPEEVEDNTEVKLQLSHACLGVDAKEGERNVVDVTTADIYGKEVTHTIVSLQIGHTEMVALNLGFLEKSTFKLVKGNGPVHLSGAYLHALGDMSDDESDSDEESEEEDVPDLVKAAEKKETVSDEKPEQKDKAQEAKKDTTKVEPVTKKKAEPKFDSKKKPEKEEDADSDEDDDEDEDDDSEDEEGEQGLLDDEASEDDEDDDEEMNMDDDGDELDSDEDDLDDEDDESDDDLSDEDEESDEEEELVPPKAKKAKVLTNGHKDDKQKTPVKKQEQKAKQQDEKQTPNKPKTPDVTEKKGKTPKSDKKKEKDAKTPVAAPASIEEVKKKLLKSPNLPKTVEKFKNFMKSAHKVTDDGDVTGLWDWLQKNKK